MFSTILTALLSKAIPSAADFFLKREELKQQAELKRLEGKVAWQEALTRRASESEGRDHEWEIERIKDSGWKDEWVLALLSIPLVGAFIPKIAPYILEGFNILQQTPDWYRWMVLIIFPAIFGIRVWRRKTIVDSKIGTNKEE